MTKPTTNTADRARFALVAALYKQQLGEVIKDRREALGLTQKDLADRANVEEPQTVSRWERGLNSPTDLDSVAKALETTVDELLRHLKPINQKERRRLLPSSGAGTQLDRIEAELARQGQLLDELVSRLPEEGLAAALEAEAARDAAQQERSAAARPRKTPRRKAS